MYSKLFLCGLVAFFLGVGCKSKHHQTRMEWPFVLSDATHNDLLQKAGKWLGVPYQYGGVSRAGIDCSGLVLALTESNRLPRSSRDMHKACVILSEADIRTGDLVFFSIGGKQVNHVGVVLQAPWFIHASSSSGVVINRWSEPYYAKWFTGFGRIPK